MATHDRYYWKIIKTLEPRDDRGEPTTPERADWGVMSALLQLLQRSSGSEREGLIRAMGEIIEEPEQPARIVAQLLFLAASLDVSQIEPNVERLARRTCEGQEPVWSALQNYRSFRHLRSDLPQSHR